jgi:hypothetical protein
MTQAAFSGPTPGAAAAQVIAAIRRHDWPALAALLAANPDPTGTVEPWQRPEGPPTIADRWELQQIPEMMIRYPGKFVVRYDTPGEPRVYKLEVIVEPSTNGFRAIDFWGLGW